MIYKPIYENWLKISMRTLLVACFFMPLSATDMTTLIGLIQVENTVAQFTVLPLYFSKNYKLLERYLTRKCYFLSIRLHHSNIGC